MRRRRIQSEQNGNLSLQDLLSNALGAVIVLTLIAAAITGTGRAFLRTPEPIPQTPEEADLVEWRPPEPVPEEQPTDTLMVEVELALDGAVDEPLLTAFADPDPEEPASELYSGGERHAYVLLLPLTEGAVWSLGLRQAGRVERMALRVHDGASLLRETDWSEPIPQCPGATTVLTLCRTAEGAPVRSSLTMSCSRPQRCE